MKEFKKILFPIDFSDSTPKILPYVTTMSQTFGGTVYLLYVVRDLKYLTSFHVPHPSIDLIEREISENSEKMMDRVCQEDLQGCPRFVKKILVGDAASEIIRYAEEVKVDLIIMGTHGRKGLEKALFGSVAEKVVKNSPVPVLIVNPYKV
jgi:nucleotide-binding universal stress UspA family protein